MIAQAKQVGESWRFEICVKSDMAAYLWERLRLYLKTAPDAFKGLQVRLGGHFSAVHAVADMLRSVRLTYLS